MKRFSIGSLQIDSERKIIYEDEQVIDVPPKAVEILLVLVENAGTVVSRKEIRTRVWGSVFVEEANLTRHISLLRNALRSPGAGNDLIKTFPKRGYQFVGIVDAVVLETPAKITSLPENPEEAVPLSGEELQALASDTSSPALQPGPGTVAAGTRLSRRRLAVVAAQAVLLLAAAGWLLLHRYGTAARPSLAVLDLHNFSSGVGEDWIGEGLRETLVAGIDSHGEARIVRADRALEAEHELQLTGTRAYSPEAVQRLGRLLAVRYVLTGSYLVAGNSVRVDLQMRDTRSGKIVSTFSSDMQQNGLAEAGGQAVTHFRSALGLKPAPAVAAYLLNVGGDPAEGYSDYLEGVHLLETADLNGALALLGRAVNEHPSYPPAHAALASVWQAMGYSQQAAEEARLAVRTSSSLNEEQRLPLVANALFMENDWPRAIDAYSLLAHRFPDSLEYALELAECETRSGHPKQALKLLAALHTKDARSDPRVPMQQATAAAAMGDWRGQLLDSGEQVRLAEASGADFLLTRGLIAEGNAWGRLGDRDRSLADYRRAQAVAASSQDQLGLADVLTARGAEEGYRKEPGAIALLQQAVALYQQMGNFAGQVNAYSELGCAYTYTEDWTAARQVFHNAIDLATRLRSPELGLGARMDLVYVALNDDDLDAAEQGARENLALGAQVSNLDAVSSSWLDLGDVDYARGRVSQARQDYRQAMDAVRQTDGGYAIAKILTRRAVLETGAGNLSLAGRLLAQAVNMNVLLGERLEYEQLAQGALLLDEGNIDDARQTMTALASHAQTAHPGAEAWRLVALCDLRQKDLSGAQAAIGKALAFARGSANTRAFLVPDSVVAARVLAAQGKPAEALIELHGLLTRSERIGDVPLELSIRLSIGQIELDSGHAAVGRTTLQQVAAAAGHAGLRLLADQAAKSLSFE